jgi:hypothetical protein
MSWRVQKSGLVCVHPQSGNAGASAFFKKKTKSRRASASLHHTAPPGLCPPQRGAEDTAFFIKKDEVQPLRGWMTKSNRFFYKIL